MTHVGRRVWLRLRVVCGLMIYGASEAVAHSSNNLTRLVVDVVDKNDL